MVTLISTARRRTPTAKRRPMDLAFATGRGPDVLTNIEGRGPLVNDEDVVMFGFRDAEEQAAYGSQPLPSQLRVIDLLRIRSRGVDAAARDAVAHLTRDRGPARGFWMHVDAEVLDDTIMPAVDYRLPDGLSWEELTTAMRIAFESHRVVGLEVTIYNPKLDPGGRAHAASSTPLATRSRERDRFRPVSVSTFQRGCRQSHK
jgi:arginase